MRRLRAALIVLIIATSCGSRAEISTPSPAVATQTATASRTEFARATTTPLCVGVQNLVARRIPGDQGWGALQSNINFVGVGAIDKMYTPTAFSLVIPGQTTWGEIVENTVLTGGITSVEDLQLATGTKVRVTICTKSWDGARTLGGWQGFYQLAAIGPA